MRSLLLSVAALTFTTASYAADLPDPDTMAIARAMANSPNRPICSQWVPSIFGNLVCIGNIQYGGGTANVVSPTSTHTVSPPTPPTPPTPPSDPGCDPKGGDEGGGDVSRGRGEHSRGGESRGHHGDRGSKN